jgi:hypothetical protein
MRTTTLLATVVILALFYSHAIAELGVCIVPQNSQQTEWTAFTFQDSESYVSTIVFHRNGQKSVTYVHKQIGLIINLVDFSKNSFTKPEEFAFVTTTRQQLEDATIKFPGTSRAISI